ncbi:MULTISPECIES: PLP-dependent aminotransferase family protein [unclassified Breznakia]|uniref:aminotransferase-like domain-containing protein n=1 Tax=unclassified Breznakia TaxID=2623764 RepID=UPI0024755AA8|nr:MULTISPECIES: PLP-dependent aminotransferase family protein [unclassified Breznakia]MDH6367475.1 2-aminoadipate transaminase [Breznakia sp. PH1-1]MDH6404552.1 2-aminoadipate transaminase [Breznakia sp. PF1-11]MDH6412261.1 2-aminoadipate transaminase [Breznakia sp. PFB1-11]MDH6414642.1 2-aminoadipate transaminase [Breznakia sp. PFB1-14]MDH6417013.1 2-aminoadipate transaminase [Breznakia sp. PFB1-4]
MKYAKRMNHIKASEIREILKITENPEVISFAGGLPAPELFPIEEIKRINEIVLEEDGQKALQYTTTEGYQPLRAWIANRMKKRLQTSFDADQILITHGSQQALDLSGKVFLDEGDYVVCESPTYLAAISAFKMYGAKFIEIDCDDTGMNMNALEEQLKQNQKIKYIYVIPDFQNPTGRTWSLEKRKRIAQLSNMYDVPIIEDNPYGELRFEGEYLPSIASFDKKGTCIVTGTFSKTYCPGYRIGWVAANSDLIKQYVLVKQGSDLQCNTMSQLAIAKFVELYDLDAHIQTITKVYKRRRDLAVQTMHQAFPKNVHFTEPEGGLFAWVELPEHINARDVLDTCLASNIAFVPGGSFFPNGGHENTFRINFSNMSEDRIVEGLTKLGDILNQFV